MCVRNAMQGRVKAGKCYRMYTEEAFLQLMPLSSPPEIQRAPLAEFVLTLKGLGVDRIFNFDFLSLPPTESLVRALEACMPILLSPPLLLSSSLFLSPPLPLSSSSALLLSCWLLAMQLLYSLGALDDGARLTPRIGAILAEVPLDPRLGPSLRLSVSRSLCAILTHSFRVASLHAFHFVVSVC